MLDYSFCHIKGISQATERKLWDEGFLTWTDVLSGKKTPLSPNKQRTIELSLHESTTALQSNNINYFAELLPRNERWRLIPHLKKPAFLDIETTGLQDYDHITTVAVAGQQRVKTYVHGENLAQEFCEDIREFESIVTFNGSCFDLPVLKKKLHINLPQVHIDLRFVFSALGIKGGLKKIEQRYDLDREELEGVDGYTAVLLWKKFTAEKQPKALETLLAYNVEDVLSLQQLLPIAFNEHRLQLAIKDMVPEQPVPKLLGNPHTANQDILAEVLSQWRTAV